MDNKRVSRFVGMAFLCLAVIQPSDLFALQEHARDGWMLGVSLGSGPGKYENKRGEASSSEMGDLFTFRVGKMIQPRLLLNAELTAWGRSEKNLLEEERNVTFKNLALAGTFYPLDRESLLGGVYVRAGIGSGGITTELKLSDASLKYDETGFGLLLGTGYELRVTKKFAFGAGVSVDKLSIVSFADSGDVYESAQFIGYALDLNWYF